MAGGAADEWQFRRSSTDFGEDRRRRRKKITEEDTAPSSEKIGDGGGAAPSSEKIGDFGEDGDGGATARTSEKIGDGGGTPTSEKSASMGPVSGRVTIDAAVEFGSWPIVTGYSAPGPSLERDRISDVDWEWNRDSRDNPTVRLVPVLLICQIPVKSVEFLICCSYSLPRRTISPQHDRPAFDWKIAMKRLMSAALALAVIVSSSAVSAADVAGHQWVRPSEQGSIMGRVIVPRSEGISALRAAKVSLIDQHGKHVTNPVESDNTGRFTFTGVQPGVYTLMIRGENAFACCAMHVVDSSVAIDSDFEIAAGEIDYSTVRNAMVRYLPPKVSQPVEFDPTANPLSSERAQTGETVRVSQFEGGLRGRLTRAGFAENLGAAEATVLVFKNGSEVARTVTDASGNFKIDELSPGSYSVLGSGKDGFGLMGLELVDPLAVDTARQDSGNAGKLVAQTPYLQDQFVMQVAPITGPIQVIEDRLIEERELGPVVPLDQGAGVVVDGGGYVTGGGGYVSGGGGGGGVGGGISGGGRLRRMLLLGGIGTAIALGADDDDTVVAPPVASPVNP